jgi:hypothetical protein
MACVSLAPCGLPASYESCLACCVHITEVWGFQWEGLTETLEAFGLDPLSWIFGL